MNRFLEELNKKILVIDGAMGTELMNRGVRPEECFDAQNLKNPDKVKEVHQGYVKAGADIIETNTFGANKLKLSDYYLGDQVREVNIAAAKIAREAIGAKGFVCGSIGPLGKMLEPLGEITFDQAYEIFAEQAKALEEGGVDALSIETISDLQEMRAAVIAAKNETKLPIIASMTFDDGEKTIYGTPPEAAVVVLEALGIDIVSANCSTGPEGLLRVVKKYQAVSNLPVMVMPNAGMPELVGDKAVYKMTPKQFGSFAVKFAKLGVKIIGGCCGTNPGHIREVKIQIPKSKIQIKSKIQNPKFASRTRIVEVKPGVPVLVGERINPTGRKIFQAEIKEGKTQIIRQEAVDQTKAGADLLDVNVSVPDVIESKVMGKGVKTVQATSDLPLSIDSPSVAALEMGLKTFCGRALLNSVNGKKETLERVLPLAKKYGAAIIALALDERGMPENVADRLRIAERIIQSAAALGIKREDIYVDNLVMTAGVGITGCLEALKAIPLVKAQFGVRTILGVSNVSHGLPGRSKINALYLKLAIAYGLDGAIIDVTDKEIKKAIGTGDGQRKGKKAEGREELLKAFKAEVDKVRRLGLPGEKKREVVVKELKFTALKEVEKMVIQGNKEAVITLVTQALEKKVKPQKIIDEGLIPGMEVVGKKFNKKEFYLPQVIEAAEAMASGFELCKARIPKDETKSTGKVILATVKGDIHDIGKNIVKMMLENHGFIVIDLGKDVPPEKIIAAAKKEKPNAIALSALLTTTMVEMGVVKDELKAAGLDIPLLVGGAVVTQGYADRIGATYSLDAVGAVALAKKIVKEASKTRMLLNKL
ncbi:MAG: homocysteine S-methyltransferase family protein [bacterium]